MIRKVIATVIACLMLASCGGDIVVIEGPKADPVETLEGYYVLPNGGFIDIYEDAQGLYSARSMRIVLANADGSNGLIPVSLFTSQAAVNGRIYFNSSPTYVPATHNIKQDSNNTLLTGALLTQITVYKSGGSLKVRAIVSNLSVSVFDHTATQQ